MKDNAVEAAQQGMDAASNVAESAAERVGEVKDEAVRQARDLVAEARDHVTQQAGQGHQALVTNLRSLGDELDRMKQQNGESGIATQLAGQAQQRVSGLADWLDAREPGQIVDEARNFARKQPAMFLLGALAAGVAAGRLARGAVELHTGDTGTTAATAGSEQTATTSTSETAALPQSDAQPEFAAPTYSAPQASTPAQGLPTQSFPAQGSPTNGSWQ